MITLCKILHRLCQPLRSFFQSLTFRIFTKQLKNFSITFYKSTCDLIFVLFYFFIRHKTSLKMFFMLPAFVTLFIVPCVALVYSMNSIQLLLNIFSNINLHIGTFSNLLITPGIPQNFLVFHTILSATLFL